VTQDREPLMVAQRLSDFRENSSAHSFLPPGVSIS
jgi:hypothetical protein